MRCFFIYSSNARIQMKQTISTTGTNLVPVSVKVGTFFSWTTMSKVFNILPLGICPCETDADAKQYTKVLCIAFGALIIGLF